MRTIGGGSTHGAVAFFVASSLKAAATGCCAGAGAGASCAQTAPPASPASAARKAVPTSLRKRVRFLTVCLAAYHFCLGDHDMLCSHIAQKKRNALAPRCALPLYNFVSPMFRVLVVASAATMETSASNVFAASAGHGAMHATFRSMNGAAVSEMAMPEVAAMVVPEIAAMIEAMIGVSIVMVTSTPVVVVVIEMFVEVAEKADRSNSHEEGRIEAPSERTVEDPISRNIGVGAKVWIPVPAGAVPIAHGVDLCTIHIRFGNVRGPQAAPVVEIVRLFGVEFLGFQRSIGAERDLVLALDLDIPVHVPNVCLALVHADLVVIGIKFVQPGLAKTHCVAVLHDHQIVLRMKLRDFDHRASLVQAKFHVGQARRNHGYGTVVTEPEESTRRQKNLRFANLSIERLTRLQSGRAYRLAVEGLARDRDLSFDIIYGSWACRVCAKSRRRQSRSQDDACCHCDQP